MIDFIAVNYNSIDYAEVFVKGVAKYVKCEHKIIIVDNSDQVSELQKLDKNIIVLQGDNDIEQGIAPSPASAAHANSIQIGIENGTSKYICLCDIDICFLNEWVDEWIPKLEACKFISHRWEPEIQSDGHTSAVKNIARPQFMIFERSWYEQNNFKFNADYQDTGGFLTKFCLDNHLPFGIIPNSYNNQNMKHNHILKEIENGEQAFLENKLPFLFHHGRGTLGSGHPKRKQWYSILTEYLL